MSEELTKYGNTPKIYKSMLIVMDEIGAIAKTRKNPQQGYQFRGIDDVLNNLQPALIKARIFILPRILEIKREEKATKTGGTITYTTVIGEYDFVAEDGSKVTVRTYGEGMDTSDKSTNKAMSAALKYAIIQTFSIPTEELVDSERDHIEPATGEPEQFINIDQCIEIQDLINETKSDAAKFLKYVIVVCETCDKGFYRKPSEIGKNIFCSKECFRKK